MLPFAYDLPHFKKELTEKYTCPEILDHLRPTDMVRLEGQGFIPAYTRTDLTNELHETFEFRTHYETQGFVVCQVPSAPRVRITPAIPFTGKINPFGMSKFIPHKIQVSITGTSASDQSYHFME